MRTWKVREKGKEFQGRGPHEQRTEVQTCRAFCKNHRVAAEYKGEQRWGAKEGGDWGGAPGPYSPVGGLGSHVVLPGAVACLDPDSTTPEEPVNYSCPSQTAGEERQS